MARWTACYEFPTKPSYLFTCSVKIRNDIWIIPAHMEAPTLKIIVFKTESREYMEIDCLTPVGFRQHIEHCFSHNGQVYIWSEYEPYSGIRVLHRLDPGTLHWEWLMESHNYYTSCVILDNIMYALYMTDRFSNIFHFEILNLDRKVVVSNQFMGECDESCLKLALNNEKVYLFQSSLGSGIRYVSVFEDGMFRVHQEDIWNTDDRVDGDENGWAGYCDGILYQCVAEDFTYYLCRFNYLKNEWEEMKVDEWIDQRTAGLVEFIEVNGTLYFILKSLSYESGREIRLLEIKPKLSTICLLNAIDQCFSSDKMAECTDLIPVILRDQWNGIIGVKMKEQDMILLDQFVVGAKTELEKLMQERLIDSYENAMLLDAFEYWKL